MLTILTIFVAIYNTKISPIPMITTKTKRVSIRDIANHAGVSVSLVSFVLNGKAKEHRVGEEISQRILRIAKELNYVPNMIAKGLRVGRSYTIGLAVPGLDDTMWSALSGLVIERAASHGYTVSIGLTGDSDSDKSDTVEQMRNRGVDGIITIPNHGSRQELERISAEGIPVVTLGRRFKDSDMASSCPDDYRAAHEATIGLIERGYRNITAICPPTCLDNMADRADGYRAAMTGHGLVTEIVTAYSADSLAKLPEALLFTSTPLCLNAIREFQRQGIAIGDDVAVMSFGYNESFDLVPVPISYIEPPISDMADAATEMLLKAINERSGLHADHSRLFPYRINWRDSTPYR